MDNHYRKMIAPVFITVLILIYLIGYGIAVMWAVEWHPLLFFMAVPIAAIAAGMVCVLIERIKEIKGGEEDDLGNY